MHLRIIKGCSNDSHDPNILRGTSESRSIPLLFLIDGLDDRTAPLQPTQHGEGARPAGVLTILCAILLLVGSLVLREKTMLLLGYRVARVLLLVALFRKYDVTFLILLLSGRVPRALKRISDRRQHTSLVVSLPGHQSLHHP